MNKLRKTPKLLLLASLGAIIFGGVAVGSTYALFTSEAETKVTATAGKVSLKNEIEVVEVDSLVEGTQTSMTGTTFNSGATYSYKDGVITLEKFLPGDKIVFNVKVTNESNVNIKYRQVYQVLEDKGLFEGLVVKIDGADFDGYTIKTDYVDWSTSSTGKSKTIKVSIELPDSAGDKYQSASCTLSFKGEAIQGNAKAENDTNETYNISTPIDLLAFARKINNNDFPYTTVNLLNDIDMSGIDYPSPYYQANHNLVFNGNSYTISNFSPVETYEGSATGSAGLIANFGSNSITVNNVNFENVNIKGDFDVNTGKNRNIAAGVVIGWADTNANATISNVSVSDVSISDVKYAGGVIGYTSGTASLSNITVSSSSSFTNKINGYTVGSIIGQVGGKTATIDKITYSGSTLVSGYKREGGVVGAVSSGCGLEIKDLDTTNFRTYVSISGNAIGDKGTYVGLTSVNTKVNGSYYYTVSSDTALQAINPTDKSNSSYIIELGEGTYNGYKATNLQGITKGVTIVGRGDKNKIIWVQANGSNSSNSSTISDAGWSFQNTPVTMNNVTVTSGTSSDYLSGFIDATSVTLNDCKVLVYHSGGAMGFWGTNTANFNSCHFVTWSNENSYKVDESNIFTYSANTYNFDSCVFDSYESSIKLYRAPNSTNDTNIKINISGCTFNGKNSNSEGAATYKSAITMHMDTPNTDKNHYLVNIDIASVKSINGNYADGLSSAYKKLIGLKDYNSSQPNYYSDQIKITITNTGGSDIVVSDLKLATRTN